MAKTTTQLQLKNKYPFLKELMRVDLKKMEFIDLLTNHSQIEVRGLGDEGSVIPVIRLEGDRLFKTSKTEIEGLIQTLRANDNKMSSAYVSDIYKLLTTEVSNGSFQKVGFTNQTLWVDKNGKTIDPFSVINKEGFVDIKDENLRGVIPYTFEIDFEADLDYDHKENKRALEELLSMNLKTKEQISYFLRIAGYLLMTGNKFKRIMLWLTSGNVPGTGKTLMADILTSFFDGQSVKIQDKALDNKFWLDSLKTKGLVNIDDITKKFRNISSDLKTWTSTMTLIGEGKGERQKVMHVPKFIMTMNEIPSADVDEALMSRTSIIKWGEKSLPMEWVNKNIDILQQKETRIELFKMILEEYENNDAYKEEFWENPSNEEWIDYSQEMIDGPIDRLVSYLGFVGGDELIFGKTSTEITIAITLLTESENRETKAAAKEALKIKGYNRQNLPRALKELGYENVLKKVEGKVKRIWVKGEDYE